MKKFKSLITEFSQESEVIHSWEGSFTSGYLIRIGIDDVGITSGHPLDRGEFLGKEVTIVIGDSESEVPKQELPVIPKFVADYIDDRKEVGFPFYQAVRIVRENSRFEHSKLREWLRTNKGQETFARAWVNGYEAEEEQKYVVEIPNPNNHMGRHKNVFLNKKEGEVFIDSANLFVNDITKYGQYALTEEEIKKDFEWAWAFAKPVDKVDDQA